MDGYFVMAEVVALRGSAVGAAGQPEPDIVEMLERWLTMAKAGEVVALALVGVAPNQRVATNFVNPSVWLHHLTSGTATLSYRLQAENPSLD